MKRFPLQVRTLARVDLLLSPAAPTTAYRIGSVSADPLEMYKGDLMTVNLNLAGAPALCHTPCASALLPCLWVLDAAVVLMLLPTRSPGCSSTGSLTGIRGCVSM